MEAKFWHESWEIGGSKTSFHRLDIHPYVQKYANPDRLKGKNVFVPLAGKTNDLTWLRSHADHVIGVELVEQPIHEFFTENKLPYKNHGQGRFETEKMTFFNRNLFDLTVQEVGQVDFVYDRASLIAFPNAMRMDYLKKMHELCSIGSQTLLITLEYEPNLGSPPFSVTPKDVEIYYGEHYEINHVEQPSLPEHRMKIKLNLDFLKEHCFILTKCRH